MSRESNEPIAVFAPEGNIMQVDVARASNRYLKFLLLSLGSSDSYFDIRYGIRGREFTIYPEKLVTDDPDIDAVEIEGAIQDLNKADYVEVEKTLQRPQRMMPGIEYYI